MKLYELLRESVELLRMPAEQLIDEIIELKELHGEHVGSSREDRRRVLDEIEAAQHDLLEHLRGEELAIHRALVVDDDWVGSLRPGVSLGDSWSYDVRGAHAYHGRGGRVLIISGTVEADQVDWPVTLAVHSSGEAEIRLAAGTPITLTGMMWKGSREPLRSDLYGETFLA